MSRLTRPLKILKSPRLRIWVWIPDADVRPRWLYQRWTEGAAPRVCRRFRMPWLEIHIGTGRYRGAPFGWGAR